MKHLIALTAALFLSAAPLHAEDADSERLLPNEEEMRELGALAEQMFRRFAEEAEPMAERLKALMGDLNSYETPEIMPNGDIIIRRKPEAEPEVTPEVEGDGIAL